MRKMRVKYSGFALGGFLVIGGWLIRLVGMLALSGHSASQAVDRIGMFASGSGAWCFLGGIVLYAGMSAREARNTPQPPLTEEEKREKADRELEISMQEIKDSIPFTAVYGITAVLLTLGSVGILLNNNAMWLGVSGLFAGLVLSAYYIRKSIRQFKWLSMYKKQANDSRQVEETR